MQENNFENQVRQTLNDLQLTPSAPVWQGVEATLKKKRDRRFVFWLLPLFLGAAGFLWWQARAWHTENVAINPTAKTTPQQQPGFSNAHTAFRQQTTSNKSQPIDKPNAAVKYHSHTLSGREPLSKNSLLIAQEKQLPQPVAGLVKTNGSIRKSKKAAPVIASKISNSFGPEITDMRTAVPLAENAFENNSHITPYIGIPISTNGLQKEPLLLRAPILKARIRIVNAPVPATPRVAQKPLEWRIVSRAGVSNLVAANDFGVRAASYYSIPSTSQVGYDLSNMVSIPWMAADARRQPAAPTPGGSFTAGVLVKKALKKNAFLVSGLQYSFYSSRQDVGSEVPANALMNRSASGAQRKMFRNNGAHNRYINQLHVIELPLAFEYRLFKNLPVQAQHGISFGQLLSSRLLQYNYTTNTFFQNAAGVRKSSFNLFTGLEATLWKTNTFSVQAGPHVQYGLQPLFKAGSSRHLLAGGLTVAMDF